MRPLCDHGDCTNPAVPHNDLCMYHARKEIEAMNRRIARKHKLPAAPLSAGETA